MKLYVVVESGNMEETDTRVLGATRYKNDAIKYAAERNDGTLYDGNDTICRVEEFESEDINTESKVMPKIRYTFIFDSSGKLLIVNDWSYTYNDYFSVRYPRVSKCYIMDISLDCNIPESAAKEIAQDKMNDYLKEHNNETES